MTTSTSIQSAISGLTMAHIARHGGERIQARAESFQQKIAELESKTVTSEGSQQVQAAADAVAQRYTKVLESLVSNARGYLQSDNVAGKAFERGMQNMANEGTLITEDSRAKLESAYNKLSPFL